jgi:hypothetical protein
MKDVQRVFKRMATSSWTVVSLGHVECRQGQKGLDLYLENFYIYIRDVSSSSHLYGGGRGVCFICESNG